LIALITEDIDVGYLESGIKLFISDEGEYEEFVVRTLAEYYDNQLFLETQYLDAKAFLEGIE
jgi:hypothetical protein